MLLELWLKNLQIGLLILVRVGALLSFTPFFSSSIIPNRVRFIFALFVSLLMTPLIISKLQQPLPGNAIAYGLMVVEQGLIGIIIGFMISSVFSAFQLAGQYFSIQIGFGMNEVVDPMGQISVPITGQFLNLIAILIFLYMGGAELTVQTLFLSFKILPFAHWEQATSSLLLAHAAKAFVGMFLIAFKLAIPIMGTIFVISTAIGLMGKIAPQMNVMMLAFPLKIMVSFAVLFMLTPVIVHLISDAIFRIFAFTDNMIWEWAKIVKLAN